MPAQHQRQAANPPASPRNHAKYTNKDGSKFITVPKSSAAAPTVASSSQDPAGSSAPTTDPSASSSTPKAPTEEPVPNVNRKKQKRRQKAAAKAAAEQAANGHASSPAAEIVTVPSAENGDAEAHASPPDDVSPSDNISSTHFNGHTSPQIAKSKKNKKKKKKGGANGGEEQQTAESHSDTLASVPQSQQGIMANKDKIWSNSNHEERERIKEFWLGLGEDERKSLVKVEKDAVLKKMKEQQKHTCSCTVCGRKRTAIEEELEGLYDAYYLELEQFANHGEGPPMLAPPPRDYPPPRPLRGLPSPYSGHPPARGRIVEHVDFEGDEEGVEEIYSEDEVDEDDFSGDEPPEDYAPEDYDDPHGDRHVADFLTFGNSLQVKGGILTVADDLLKNDGKRFIEMMEQLAERRMQREGDAQEHAERVYGPPHGAYANVHNHPPPEDDDEDYEEEEEEEEEDDGEEYDDNSQEDEEYEDEEDQMTEEQRMEEGRRMFQIFAARMFEQRVLSAYKEKVAEERQQKLLEELDEETRIDEEQRAKKAKNAQKKKDKAAQKKQALAEEKARKEAEKAAEEAARLEAEQRRIVEQQRKAEEKRKAREAQKKADEEARLKKEAERQRKIHEQRERQAEQERKAREAKEREKKMKEEQRLKEHQARELKEREARERKDKQERDKREKEARAAKAQKDAQEAREAKERAKEEKAAALKTNIAPQASQVPSQPAKRGSGTAPVSTVQLTAQPSHVASPQVPVATPAMPKAALPSRQRTASQQAQDVPQNGLLANLAAAQHAAASTPSQASSPHPMTPHRASPGLNSQHRKSSGGTPGPGFGYDSASSPERTPQFHSLPPLGMGPLPGLAHQMPPPGFAPRTPQDPILPPGFRQASNMMVPPPGINGSIGRGFPPASQPPPGFHGHADAFGMNGFGPGPTVPQHGRQGSTGFDGTPILSPAQPISRPAPIGRPQSDSRGRTGDDRADATEHLGSSALVDDEDDAPEPLVGSFRNNNQPPGPRPAYGASPFLESSFPLPVTHAAWGPPSMGSSPFPAPSFGAAAAWGQPAPPAPPGLHAGSPTSGLPPLRPTGQPRHVLVRTMLCQACRELVSVGKTDANGYASIASIKAQVEQLSSDPSITEQDLLDLCDTEGSSHNGGGSFDLKPDERHGGAGLIRWMPDPHHGMNPQRRAVGAPGEIGSPMIGQASIRGI